MKTWDDLKKQHLEQREQLLAEQKDNPNKDKLLADLMKQQLLEAQEYINKKEVSEKQGSVKVSYEMKGEELDETGQFYPAKSAPILPPKKEISDEELEKISKEKKQLDEFMTTINSDISVLKQEMIVNQYDKFDDLYKNQQGRQIRLGDTFGLGNQYKREVEALVKKCQKENAEFEAKAQEIREKAEEQYLSKNAAVTNINQGSQAIDGGQEQNAESKFKEMVRESYGRVSESMKDKFKEQFGEESFNRLHNKYTNPDNKNSSEAKKEPTDEEKRAERIKKILLMPNPVEEASVQFKSILDRNQTDNGMGM